MTLPLLALLSGCAADYTKPAVPPSPTYADPGVDQTGAGPVIPLILADATLALPAKSRPGEAEVQSSWNLTVVHKAAKSYTAELPFDLGNPRGYPPAGVTAMVDGRRSEYSDNGLATWNVNHRDFTLRWPSAPTSVVIEWPDLASQIKRRSLAASGLEPSEFARWSMVLEGETRQGLLLPAPATADFELEIPKDRPTFGTWLSMDHTPLPGDVSDGASAVIEVIADGKTTEVGRKAVSGTSEHFERFQADLSKWAGKKVTVRLRSDPGSNPDHDYLFWGSPSIWGAPTGEVRRIVVIGIDTTRPDHFGFNGYSKPTSPELDAIAANAALFDFAWTPAPRTRPSFRSATTGRFPLEAVGAKNISEVFQEQGFVTAGIVANVHLQPRFGFDVGFDDWIYDNGAKADTQVDRALTFFRQHPDRDAYLFMHILDPHIFYAAPGGWREKFVTTTSDLPPKVNRWGVYKRMAAGTLKDTDKQYLEEHYDGEIAYTSYQLGRFFHELDKLGGKTLVVVHSDHGEEFWEHGGFEHNHSLYTETTKGLLMVRPGTGFKGGKRIDTPVTLADIAPTLYDYAGIPSEGWPVLDGQSLRPLIEGASQGSEWDRSLPIGHLRYGKEQWAVVHDRHKYILHTATGHEELYDLRTDPREQTDLVPGGADLAPFRRALADAHNMPVCPGIRVAVRAPKRSAAFTIELPEVPLAIEILDPERAVDEPSNQAWGIPPTRTPSEIGTIDWEPGSATFTWKPGTKPINGQIFAFYDHPVLPREIKLTRGENEEIPLQTTPKGQRFMGGDATVTFASGVVLSPPVGEAERMRLLKKHGDGSADGADMEMLIALGYVGNGEGDDGHGHGGPPDSEAPEDEAAPDEDGATPEEGAATDGSEAPPVVRDALTPQACRW